MRWIYVLVLLILFSSCQEEEFFTVRDYPFVETISVSSIDETGVTLDFRVSELGSAAISAYGVKFIIAKFGGHVDGYKSYVFLEKEGALGKEKVSFKITQDIPKGNTFVASPFVKSGGKTVFGEPVTFTSQGGMAAEIKSVSTSKIIGTMEFTIKGQYFSNIKENNLVEIPGLEEYFQISVLSSTDQEIKVLLQRLYGSKLIIDDSKFALRVTTSGLTSEIKDHFTFGFQTIKDISPLRGYVGEAFHVLFENEPERDAEKLYFNYNRYPSSDLKLGKMPEGGYQGLIPNLPPGKYPISFVESHISVFPESFEVLNSWKVIKENANIQGLEFYTKLQAGENILFFEGRLRDLHLYNIQTDQKRKLKEFEGIINNRSSLLRTISQDRYLYYGLGFVNPSNPFEYLSDFNRLDLLTNQWEKLPDFPKEKTMVSKSFSIQDKIYVVSYNYDNFFVFDPITKVWQESQITVPSGFRESTVYAIDGENIYFTGNSQSIHLFRIGETPSVIVDSINNSGSTMVIVKGELYLIKDTDNIVRINLSSNHVQNLQTVFQSPYSQVFPILTPEGLLLAFPHHSVSGIKPIIYKLDHD